jgi:hypothetical protein
MAVYICDFKCLSLHFREISAALQEATQGNYARLMAIAFSILIFTLVSGMLLLLLALFFSPRHQK